MKKPLDQEKIILMTHLAIYDEHQGRADREKLKYFRHDYIYRQNLWTRVFVIISGLILALFYVGFRVVFENFDIFQADLLSEGYKIGAAIVGLMVVYSFIGTMKGSLEYEGAASRVKVYISYINRLEERKRELAAPPLPPDGRTIKITKPTAL